MTDLEQDLYTMCGFPEGLNSSNFWEAGGFVGYPNSYFYDYYNEIGTGWDWDYCCSEIACTFSYIAGNLSKIFVAGWAGGLVAQYEAAGQFDRVNPRPGDFIFFQYGSGEPEHTGRIAGVENGVIYTVEGNVGGGVRALSYSTSDWTIYGFGHPAYTDQPVDSYTVRTSSPAGQDLPYYNTAAAGGYNSCGQGSGPVSGANVLNSDIGYAQGRLVEMYNELYPATPITSAAGNIYSFFNVPAQDWYNAAVDHNLQIGSNPQYAAVGVWYNSSQDKGHVAVLENYVDGRWIITEGYSDYPDSAGSWDYSWLENNTDYLPVHLNSDWTLIGFIYPFNFPYPPPAPEQPKDPEPDKKKKNIWVYLRRLPF